MKFLKIFILIFFTIELKFVPDDCSTFFFYSPQFSDKRHILVWIRCWEAILQILELRKEHHFGHHFWKEHHFGHHFEHHIEKKITYPFWKASRLETKTLPELRAKQRTRDCILACKLHYKWCTKGSVTFVFLFSEVFF